MSSSNNSGKGEFLPLSGILKLIFPRKIHCPISHNAYSSNEQLVTLSFIDEIWLKKFEKHNLKKVNDITLKSIYLVLTKAARVLVTIWFFNSLHIKFNI